MSMAATYEAARWLSSAPGLNLHLHPRVERRWRRLVAVPLLAPVPRSLVWATDIDVLPLDRVVERRDGYLVARSPTNPQHYWGNLLVMDDPPAEGDAARWEALFDAEFAAEPRVRHRTFVWDRCDGELGAARTEFVECGYDLEQAVGLVAEPDGLRPRAAENREVRVRALRPDADEELWDQVAELQVASRDPKLDEAEHRQFVRGRLQALRDMFTAGHGAWYVALDPGAEVDPGGAEVVGSCGVVVTGGRGRFQAVDTAEAHRRRGICSRLVVAAARDAAERFGARQLVIVADPDYHALGLYESLGFERMERTAGVCLRPETRRELS
jgi:ribosomal protein S18 acetylase RimI-like enzyme